MKDPVTREIRQIKSLSVGIVFNIQNIYHFCRMYSNQFIVTMCLDPLVKKVLSHQI